MPLCLNSNSVSNILKRPKISSTVYFVKAAILEELAKEDILLSESSAQTLAEKVDEILKTEKSAVGLEQEVQESIVKATMQLQQIKEQIAEARQEIPRLEEEAKRRGFLKGKEEGFQGGKKEVLEQMNAVLGQCNQTIQRLKAVEEEAEDEKRKALERLEPEVVKLSLEIARRVVKQEIKQNQDSLLPVVREAMKKFPGAKELTVYVHPSRVEKLKERLKELYSIVGEAQNLQVLADAVLAKDDVVLESESGQADARLETQFDEIGKALGI